MEFRDVGAAQQQNWEVREWQGNKGDRKNYFRVYSNEAYEEGLYTERGFAGKRMTTSRAAVKTGMVHKLMRVGKYSNCCMDCASLLQSVNLLHRGYRLIQQKEIVRGNKSGMQWGDIWVDYLANRVGTVFGDLPVKDASADIWRQTVCDKLFVMKGKRAVKTREDNEKFQDAWGKVSTYLQNKHNVSDKFTKHVMPPDIYVQKKVADPKTERDEILKGLETTRKLEKRGSVSSDDLSGAAVTDMLADIRAKYEHLAVKEREVDENTIADIDHTAVLGKSTGTISMEDTKTA